MKHWLLAALLGGAGALSSALPAAGQASQPAYIGRWAEKPSLCQPRQGPLDQFEGMVTISQRTVEGNEFSCDIHRISGQAGQWRMATTCHVEGTESRETLEVRVERERMTLVYVGRRGKPQRYVRCG